jgi:DNA processing protein
MPAIAFAQPMPPDARRDLLIALNRASGLGRPSLCRLALELDGWLGESAAKAGRAAAIGVPAAQLARARALVAEAPRLAAEEKARAERGGLRILTLLDADYPTALSELALPPPVLYLRGQVEVLRQLRTVAIVGARRMNAYGRECTRHFAGGLARAGLCIVSGFAIGIDSLAHDTAIENGVPTVAILGCGLDVDYPAGSRERAAAIAGSGALITEFPLGCQPRPLNFPIRNRLIAALAEATLVIQAKLRSGSLITAGHALDLGRDVFAVPGPIFDELAMGSNELIAAGAHPALCARDLLDRLGIAPPAGSAPAGAEPAGHPILAALAGRRDGLLAEDLSTALGEPLDQVLGALLELELEGRIERRPGPLFALRG